MRREFSKTVKRDAFLRAAGKCEGENCGARLTVGFDYLAERFAYDPETGVITWRWRPREHFATERGFRCFNSREAFTAAGSQQPNAYLAVRVDGKLLYVHRIAFVLGFMQEIPPMMVIDHIDRDKTNNRMDNLRLASRAENGRNSVSGRSSLPKNVYWDEGRQKFFVLFTYNYKTVNGGRFSDLSDAEACARRMREKLHGSFCNHGASQ